uniref:Dipeptidyl-peptidase VI n=1 Tax=uncultured bacterium AOCefta2 TaxID=654977 RepID=D6MLX9_9BACT|nr:dipeptidyl-peptidase VI [uncultured bacterium AOCefta2]
MNTFEQQQELFALKTRARVDPRITAMEVAASRKGTIVTIAGFSANHHTDACVRAVAADVFGRRNVRFELKVLTRDYPLSFYEVTVANAVFYKTTKIIKADLLTEAFCGSVIRGYFEHKGWIFCQHSDGYVGYVPKASLVPADKKRYLRWKNGKCATLQRTVKLGGMSLAPCTRLIYDNGRVNLPGDKWVRVSARDIKVSKPGNPAFIRSVRRHTWPTFKNTKYLWGGKTQIGIDCSGFMQTLALLEGILLPRDASMQAYVGEITGYLPDYSDMLPGDLILFINDQAKYFHVGIWIGNDMFLHSSGTKNIIISSMHPSGKNYMARYGETFAFGRRIHL